MIDHLGFSVSNMERAKAFYLNALKPLGIGVIMEVSAEETGGDAHAGFGKDSKAFFWIGTGNKPGAVRTWRSPRERAPMSIRSTMRLWPPADGTMARPDYDLTTIRTTTGRLFSILMATTSKPCAASRSEGIGWPRLRTCARSSLHASLVGMRDRKSRIAIIGAGVGGLTLWLALRQRGLFADLYEQARELTEIGAAVALSANGTRELERLGVLERIVAASTEPTELVYRDGRTGGRIAAHPVRLGGAYRERFGAPYCGLHRAELQRALGAGVDRERLNFGRRLVDLFENGDRVTLSFADGGIVQADGVIAADGVRSVVRRFVAVDDGLLYSRTSGFRGIISVGNLPSLPYPQAIQFWMGPSAHLLH
jgi:FAD binding domain